MIPKFKPQSEFPLLKEYSKVFKTTSDTIFAFVDTIYTNNSLPEHLIIHEIVHLKRQNKLGVDVWVDKFLTNKEFRLKEEVLAYQAQLKSVKDREARYKLSILCARTLSSDMYDNICSFPTALKLLQIR